MSHDPDNLSTCCNCCRRMDAVEHTLTVAREGLHQLEVTSCEVGDELERAHTALRDAKHEASGLRSTVYAVTVASSAALVISLFALAASLGWLP